MLNIESYLVVKALHVIFMVAYFAGLFYIVRLFIYHSETLEEEKVKREILQTQFIKMEKLLWNIITVPSFCIMLFTGLLMLITNWESFKTEPWMHIKLTLLIFLFLYHFICFKMIRNFSKNKIKYTSMQLRYWNEVATLILFAVVFTVILKSYIVSFGWFKPLIAFLVLTTLTMLTVKWYQKHRESKKIK